MRIGNSAAYENFVGKLMAAGKTGIVATQHTLQLEVNLTTVDTVYDFRLTDDAGGKLKSERRLNQNDVFMVTGLQVLFCKRADDNDVKGRYCTYPNATLFPNSKGDLEAVYNGVLKMTVDNKVYVPGYDLLQHRSVPRSQDMDLPDVIQDSLDLSRDGIIGIYPTITLQGNKTSQIQAVLPSALASVEAGVKTRLVLRLHGFLAQNAAL